MISFLKFVKKFVRKDFFSVIFLRILIDR